MNREGKIAYLTIDDAPSDDFKEKVDFLASKKIPAVFFCEGEFLEESEEDITYAIKKGFIIGNHGYKGHPYFSNLTLEQAKEQIKKADELIDKMYEKAGIRRPAKFFRFPYGDKGGNENKQDYKNEKPFSEEGRKKKEEIQEFLRQLGYTHPKFKGITYKYFKPYLDDADWYWTYDCFEYSIFSKNPYFGIDSIDKVYARMDEDVPEGCRGLNYPDSEEIILLHDHDDTTKYFKLIIEKLLSKGIKFKLPELR
ncbi:MAG: polysaccharide deacetylase family protein [archaeon]